MERIKTAEEQKAIQEKRLEKMRANLAMIEMRAEFLLAKGETMTTEDRIELLQLVNVAFHESGKIEGIFSVDSCAACEFCQRMIKAAADNILMICGSCYANADSWKEAAWRRHKLNARIFSSVLFTVEELKTLPLYVARLVRFNEDGDTVNEIMGRNYLRIARAFYTAFFGYFYKNTSAVESALIAEGYTSREKLPENIRFIHSSILIGFEAAEKWFDDCIFTVYPDKATTEEAIARGAWECNGRKCQACGFHCYLAKRQEKPVHIAEVLRCSAAKRAVILAAYNAKKAAA